MELPTKIVSFVTAGGTAIATMWGGAAFVDTRYQHHEAFVVEVSELREELNATNDRIEYRQLNDVLRQKDLAVQRIEERNKGAPRSEWPQADRERANEIEMDKKEAERKLSIYEQRVLKSK